jgi:type VI secretion system secreted protein Hcp
MAKGNHEYDMFLLLEAVPGASTAKGRKDWIDVAGVEWGVEQSVAISGTGGGMTGTGAKHRALRFTAPSGAASPLLFDACMSGQHIKTAAFEVQHGKSVVIRWTFEDMLVTSFTSEADDVDSGLRDTFTLLARRLRYTTTDTRGWDFVAKQPW